MTKCHLGLDASVAGESARDHQHAIVALFTGLGSHTKLAVDLNLFPFTVLNVERGLRPVYGQRQSNRCGIITELARQTFRRAQPSFDVDDERIHSSPQPVRRKLDGEIGWAIARPALTHGHRSSVIETEAGPPHEKPRHPAGHVRAEVAATARIDVGKVHDLQERHVPVAHICDQRDEGTRDADAFYNTHSQSRESAEPIQRFVDFVHEPAISAGSTSDVA